MATPDVTTEALSAGGNDTASAPSGPPPVATRHDHQGVIVTSIERPAPDLVESCRALYTGLVLDHLGKHGGMTPDVKPVWSGASLCGPAITCLGTDWRIRSMAADLAEPGDVIVVAAGGVTGVACFGDMTATGWKSKGIEGVVIDGACRDVAGLRALGFPAFARAVTPRNFHYPAGLEHGAVNVPVVCAGVLVEPGDIVIGDDDGVVVVPGRIAPEIVAAANAFVEGERGFRAMLSEQYVSLVPRNSSRSTAQVPVTPVEWRRRGLARTRWMSAAWTRPLQRGRELSRSSRDRRGAEYCRGRLA